MQKVLIVKENDVEIARHVIAGDLSDTAIASHVARLQALHPEAVLSVENDESAAE
jgi:hypothetical protein